MPPLKFEYLFILLIYMLAGASILSSALKRLIREKAFWLSNAVFVVLGTFVDLMAIHWNWWYWNPERICGWRLLGIPLEEYLGFILGHMLTVCGWKVVTNDVG